MLVSFPCYVFYSDHDLFKIHFPSGVQEKKEAGYKSKRFNAQIRICGKKYSLGMFHTAREAGIMFAKAKVYRDNNMKATTSTTESKKPSS